MWFKYTPQYRNRFTYLGENLKKTRFKRWKKEVSRNENVKTIVVPLPNEDVIFN